MGTRRQLLGLGFAALIAACSRPSEEAETPAAPTAAPVAAAPTDPAGLIRPLYDRYRTDPAVTTFPALPDSAPWSDSLKTLLIAMMARSEARNEPILDFDPIIGAQDWELQNVDVTTDAVAEGSHAVVRAAVTNAGFSEDIVYDLVWEHESWRINNIRGKDWDLRQIASS